MTVTRLPRVSAGLVGLALCLSFAASGATSACAPSAGPLPSEEGPGGRAGGASTTGVGGRVTGGRGSGGATSGAAGGTDPGGAPPENGGSPPGVGGTIEMGGAPPAGGLPNIGGTCNVQVVDPNTLPPCTTCAGGRCVNPADYPNAPASALMQCESGGICLPDALVATKGNVALPRCTSISGAEGRCTSLCIPAAAQLGGFLPQDVCGTTDRCGPCYSPIDGTSTGICNVGCDPGPTQPAVVFPQCCSGRARCVPRSAIPDGPAKSNLSKEKCTGTNDPVCVPTEIIQNPAYKFPACVSQNFLDPGKPGVCVPACIVNANPAGAALKRDNCADATDKCVPCVNPANGMASGACN